MEDVSHLPQWAGLDWFEYSGRNPLVRMTESRALLLILAVDGCTRRRSDCGRHRHGRL